MPYINETDNSHNAAYQVFIKPSSGIAIQITATLISGPIPSGTPITEAQRDQTIQDLVDLIETSSAFDLNGPGNKIWTTNQEITSTLPEG